jgi:hypothetical protein
VPELEFLRTAEKMKAMIATIKPTGIPTIRAGTGSVGGFEKKKVKKQRILKPI